MNVKFTANCIYTYKKMEKSLKKYIPILALFEKKLFSQFYTVNSYSF